MSTRRDTELTQMRQDPLFAQIRALFRHVPLTNTTFALLAPNVAASISPGAPQEAFPVLWGLVDELEEGKPKGALIALLGLGSNLNSNVLDRKTTFDSEKDPRTIARWADGAIRDLVTLIRRRFIEAKAEVRIRVEQRIGRFDVIGAFESKARMDTPSVHELVGAVPGRRVVSLDVPHTDDGAMGFALQLTSVFDYEDMEDNEVCGFTVEWLGEVVPQYRLSLRTQLLLNIHVSQGILVVGLPIQ